jgi:hypothetical protein
MMFSNVLKLKHPDKKLFGQKERCPAMVQGHPEP